MSSEPLTDHGSFVPKVVAHMAKSVEAAGGRDASIVAATITKANDPGDDGKHRKDMVLDARFALGKNSGAY